MAKVKAGEKFIDMTVNTNVLPNVKISQLVDGKPTFFWFLRYIGCTICRWDVHTLAQRYNEFVKKGVNVIVVMQSKPEIVQRDLNGQVLPFHLICDENQELYKTLELNSVESKEQMAPTDEAKARLAVKRAGVQAEGFVHGDYEGNEMQLPGFFAVDKDMVITEAHYGEHIADIPTVDEMLAKIPNKPSFRFVHENYNVKDLEKSMKFYEEALGLKEVKRNEAADGSFIIVYMGDGGLSDFLLELTWLRDWDRPYNLGDNEIHLAFRTDDFDAAYAKHKEMGCICYENPKMGIYFISDPDGYWLEVVPTRKK